MTISGKTYRVKSRCRFIGFITFILIFLIMLTNTFLGLNEADSLTREEYLSVEVKAGDTLWNIAATYMSHNEDVRKAVHTLCGINGISAHELRAGQVLLVPWQAERYESFEWIGIILSTFSACHQHSWNVFYLVDESDIDILILANISANDTSKFDKNLTGFANGLGLENDILISIFVKDCETFYKFLLAEPFYQSVLKDGVLLSAWRNSIFHSTQAVLTTIGYSSKKHSGSIAEFRKSFVKNGPFSDIYSDILGEAFNVRAKSDYDIHYIIAKADVVQQLANAKIFFEAVQEYIKTL